MFFPSLTSIQNITSKIIVLCILIFSFERGEGKTKDPEQNSSKHSLNLTCSYSIHEYYSDSLPLFPNA
jgi:hypothetical protein